MPLDVPTTEALAWNTYRYAGLLDSDDRPFESSGSMASTLATPMVQLVYAYVARNDRDKMERAIDAAARLSPNPGVRSGLRALALQAGDSLVAP